MYSKIMHIRSFSLKNLKIPKKNITKFKKYYKYKILDPKSKTCLRVVDYDCDLRVLIHNFYMHIF